MEASFPGQQQLDVAYPAPAPAPTDESPTSSVIDPNPSHADSAADEDHPANGHAGSPRQSLPPAGGFLDKMIVWISRRCKRKVKYSAPFDRFFEHLDLWKLLAVLGAMVVGITTFRNYNFISKECMRALILMLCFSFFFLMIAYTLQDMVPEIAVGAMITGIALVIVSFHTAGLHLLDLPEEKQYLAISVLLVSYIALFLLTLQKLVKDDVREKEETEETKKAHDDMV